MRCGVRLRYKLLWLRRPCGGRRGRGGHTQFFQLGAGAAFFLGAGVPARDFTEFADGSGFLAEFEQGFPPLQPRWRQLEALGIVLEHFVVFAESLPILLLREKDLAEIKLGVRGQVRVRVILEIDLASNAQLYLGRSEEHTSELQSRLHLVCRLLLEKKKK